MGQMVALASAPIPRFAGFAGLEGSGEVTSSLLLGLKHHQLEGNFVHDSLSAGLWGGALLNLD
jgi:hypothetical protein